jgi:hypothetical protein
MGIIKSGDNGNVANVTDEKKLEVAAVSESSLEFASKNNSCAFSWISTYAATGGQEVVYIKNTSPSKSLIIDEIVVGCSAASVFTLFKVTSGTAAGTTLTSRNLDLSSGSTSPDTAFGNAPVTGSLTGTTVAIDGVTAGMFQTLDLKGSLVLRQNDEIAVTSSATGTVYITVIGHFKA